MKIVREIIILALVLSLVLPVSVMGAPAAQAPAAAAETVSFTILHHNDFHGNLMPVPASSYPGMARLAKVVKDIRTAVGADNVLLLDAGDFMQGTLLSNLYKGAPTVAVYNHMGYVQSTLGNHEFDWGQTALQARAEQADFPFLSANVVVNNTGNCATAGWESPDFATPWMTTQVGTGENKVTVGLIGVTTVETPYITIPSATEGLCFRDPAEAILRYYNAVDAASDYIVVMSHLGLEDGGYGYGLTVYGDKSLAGKLNTAGKPVNMIIGGHSHTNMSAAFMVGNTAVVQAHSAGRRVGRADITYNLTTGASTLNWTSILVPMTGEMDQQVVDIINYYAEEPGYKALVNTVIGYTGIDLIRDYNGDGTMGAFVQDAVLNDLLADDDPVNDADMIFNNPGGIRVDITRPSGFTEPYTLTYGMLYDILPFGNQTIVGDMKGAHIIELLNQSATLFRGALQPAGVRYSFYRYGDSSTYWAWGAFDIEVFNRDTEEWEPIDPERVYRVATNEFLAPAGQDGFTPFKYMTNISYHGDMLDGLIRWVSENYTYENPYYATLDGRIKRYGDNTGGPVVPVTLLHNNDSHGYLDNYAKLATFIEQRRAFNPTRTLLLNAGDQIQGDSMMYYFKSAALGYAADGTPLEGDLAVNPMMAVMNYLDYDAMVVGNHEYNFGSDVFKSTLAQADFAVLQANVEDTGAYGLGAVPVEPYKLFDLDGIEVAVLGIGNHRVPSYELPSNIPGLSFSNPITTAQAYAGGLKTQNDLVVALTHIGFTSDPTSVEVDSNVDTVLAAETPGVDVIIGGHSHTSPKTGFGAYKWLPTFVGGPDGNPVMISQANRRNLFLGEMVVGFLPDGEGGYRMAGQSGRFHEVVSATPAHAGVAAVIQPYKDLLNTYNNTVIGSTSTPIDTLKAYTEETNGANLQADAAVFELDRNGISVDFHLSGAMTNAKVAEAATPQAPVTLKVSDMFSLMPYENSLLVLELNGPQLKRILERAYRNYYYYKYVEKYGGYSYYTTCMLDINAGGQITYHDAYPNLPSGNNVLSLKFGENVFVDFEDADTYYRVSTVNYLAAGACNFSDAGETLWPLDQITDDTQFYVRDAVINYISAQEDVIAPAVEGRLNFISSYAVEVSADALMKAGQPGDTVSYVVTIENTGFYNDTYTIALSGTEWAQLVGPANVPVAAGASATVVVNVVVPANAAAGDYVANVTITSQGDSNVSKALVFTTTVESLPEPLTFTLFLPLIFQGQALGE